MNQIRSVRGMRDVYGADARRWTAVAERVVAVLAGYGYQEIRLPLLEFTALFSRGVGEATDIVEKEMYTLADRDGDSLTLRPEGTAGCVRALIEHGLLHNQTQRVYYTGPMFRYERPQKGRYRQFDQIGAEAFGMPGPDIDAEMIALGAAMWRMLDVSDVVTLELNTLGSSDARRAYRDALVAYLEPRASALDEDGKRRLTTNPLRILDSKDERTRELLEGAPLLSRYVDAEARVHFDSLCAALEELGIPYVVNPTLVRGLDYYTHTVFEWTTDALGAQGTVCAGGRYDRLVETLGGRPTPALGFALGIDRLVLLHETVAPAMPDMEVDVYCCVMDPALTAWALNAADRLRGAVPDLRVRVHHGGGSLKRQFRRADRSGARLALVVGEDERANDTFTVKWLREDREQAQLSLDALIALCAQT